MNIVSRADWGARGTQSRHGRMKLPAVALYLHHTVTSVSSKPAADMLKVEAVGMKRFGQFSYSYCVHPDGTVLEGAGRMVGAHTAGRNSTTFGVALIGNYDERAVTVFQVDAVRQLIDWLIDNGDLLPGVYPTGGHRDVATTACPGDKAYRLLDAFRAPWTPVSPPPASPATTYDYDGGAVKTTLLEIRLGEKGRGWVDWDPGLNRDPIIVGAVLLGPSPPDDDTDPTTIDDNYWSQQESVNLAAQPRSGKVRVVARGGRQGDVVKVWVSCA